MVSRRVNNEEKGLPHWAVGFSDGCVGDVKMRTTLSAHTAHKRLLVATMIAACFPGFVAAQCTVGTTVSPSEANLAANHGEIDLVSGNVGTLPFFGLITGGDLDGTVLVDAHMPAGLTCDPNEQKTWRVAVGDDTGSLSGDYSSQNFGGFPGATVGSTTFGDWRDKTQFCFLVENSLTTEAFVQLWAFTAESRTGVGRFIRTFSINDGDWIPGATTDMGVTTNGSAVVCLDLADVPDLKNVTGFGALVGAFPPDCDQFCRDCAVCRDCDDDAGTDTPACPSGGCPTNEGNEATRLNKCQDQDRDCIPASREAEFVHLHFSQAAPNIVIDVDLGTDSVQPPSGVLDFQAGEARDIGIENDGSGPLTLDIKITGTNADQFRVVGSSLLAAGSSKVVAVTYAPDEITQMNFPHTATLEIKSDDPDQCVTNIGLSGVTTTNLRLAVSGRQTIKACVVLTVLAPPTDILSVGTRVSYDASQLEFVGVKEGPALTIVEAVVDDPITPDVDESAPAEVWEINHQEAVNGVVSVAAFDQSGLPIVLEEFAVGDIFDLYCLNFKFIVPPACEDPVETSFDFGAGPRNGFFPNFDNYFTASPDVGPNDPPGLPVETEVTSLVDGTATIAANQFVRGDVTFDGLVELQDATDALLILFGDLMLNRNCPAALDANDDGELNILDTLTIIQTAFLSSTVQPAPPFPVPASVIASGDDQNSELACKEGLGCEFVAAP